MKVNRVKDASFQHYGKVLDGIDTKEILKQMEQTPIPADVIYEPSIADLEKGAFYQIMTRSVYGNMPIQIGYCNGHNQKLNALEFHKSSEINVAATDLILLLGKQQDMKEDGTFDTSRVDAFLVPKGTVIEIYATTLHYAPCGVENEGFRCVVVLPKGTNYPVTQECTIKEDRMLFATNKWLIAHQDAGIEGAFIGLKGENLMV